MTHRDTASFDRIIDLQQEEEAALVRAEWAIRRLSSFFRCDHSESDRKTIDTANQGETA